MFHTVLGVLFLLSLQYSLGVDTVIYFLFIVIKGYWYTFQTGNF